MKRRYAHHLVVILAVAGGLLSGTAAWAQEKKGADAILGKWWFPEKNGQMEIRLEKGEYFGKVVAYDETDALDKNNPDPELAKRKFLGIDMLSNFKHDAKKDQWSGGTIYDGKSGKTYKCSLWFDDGDTSQLKARGYVGLSLFGRTEIFTRVTAKDEKPKAEVPPSGKGT